MSRFTTAALAVTGLLALPGVADASQQFGSPLAHAPANGERCDNLDQSAFVPCTLVGLRHGDPPNGLKEFPAPSDGVVTKLRIRTTPSGPVTFAFANLTEQGTGNTTTAVATLEATGPTVTPAGTGEVEEFPARVPVKKGVRVALQSSSGEIGAVYNSDGGRKSYEFAPPLTAGQGPRGASDHSGGDLLVQAVLEPDADNDGYGDETQDQCLNNAAHALPCPVAVAETPQVKQDLTAPKLTSVALTRTGLRYRLSEKASVTIRLRKAGRTVRTLKRSGAQGSNTAAISRRKLSAGRYYVAVAAQDKAGNRSAVKWVSFRVKR